MKWSTMSDQGALLTAFCESTGAGHNDRLSDHLSYGSSYTELF